MAPVGHRAAIPRTLLHESGSKLEGLLVFSILG